VIIKEIVAMKSIMYLNTGFISVVDKMIRRNAVVAIFEFLFSILLIFKLFNCTVSKQWLQKITKIKN